MRDDFKKHMDNWLGLLPTGFHRFIQHRMNKETNSVYEEAKKKWKKFPQKYNVEEDFAKKYIEETLKHYKSLKNKEQNDSEQ